MGPSGNVPERRRFLLYDVNPAEGFNLRRDALIRAALLTRLLGPEWTLVLPPFPRMPHWRAGASEGPLPWRTFFHIPALKAELPVMELDEYARTEGRRVDLALHLVLDRSDYSSSFRITPMPCPEVEGLEAGPEQGSWSMRAFGDSRPLGVARIECRSVFAPFSALVGEISADPADSILLHRFETSFWDGSYAGEEYWRIRSGLVFAERLRREAERFVQERLRDRRYLAVHLRRGDFVSAGRELPSLEEVAEQVDRMRKVCGVGTVFLATDASSSDVDVLRRRFEVVRYGPQTGDAWLEGETAIIDQIIAAGAEAFIGTEPSTFSNVIRQERDLDGHPRETTWNTLCRPVVEGDNRSYANRIRPMRAPPESVCAQRATSGFFFRGQP